MIDDGKNKQEQNIETMPSARLLSPCIASIAGYNQNKDIFVQFDNAKPVAARLVAGLSRHELADDTFVGREVLLVFEKGNPELPIIVSLMENPMEHLIALELPETDQEEAPSVRVDGKQVTIEAAEEMLLKCGKGSIKIDREGKIVIKGSQLLSRTSGVQRIKGARVDIN